MTFNQKVDLSKIEDLEDKLGGVAECGDIPFNHKTNKKTQKYIEEIKEFSYVN